MIEPKESETAPEVVDPPETETPKKGKLKLVKTEEQEIADSNEEAVVPSQVTTEKKTAKVRTVKRRKKVKPNTARIAKKRKAPKPAKAKPKNKAVKTKAKTKK